MTPARRSPDKFALATFLQLPRDGCWVVPEETQKHIAPGILRFALVAVPIDGKPVDGFARFVEAIGVAFVMLRVHRIIIGLRKAARDRLTQTEEPVEQRLPEKGIMDKIVPHPIDVGVHHQGVNKAEEKHQPKRRMRIEKEHSQKIGEVQ